MYIHTYISQQNVYDPGYGPMKKKQQSARTQHPRFEAATEKEEKTRRRRGGEGEDEEEKEKTRRRRRKLDKG